MAVIVLNRGLMKKLFYILICFALLTATLGLVSCSSLEKAPIYNSVISDGVSLSLSHSADGVAWHPLSSEEPLFKKKIYADGETEIVRGLFCFERVAVKRRGGGITPLDIANDATVRQLNDPIAIPRGIRGIMRNDENKSVTRELL